MVLIGRRVLIAASLLAVLATAFIGVYAYRTLAISGGGPASVFAGQQVLYVALLLVVVEAFIFVRIFLRSRNIERELDKLIEITRFRGLSSAHNLTRLGPIGAQISRLYDQLNSLSERKSLKISSLSELAEFLMSNVSVPTVAATVDGTIVYVSRVYTERNKRPRNEIVDGRIEDLTPGVEFSEVLVELDRVHSSVERKSEKTVLTFYPIRNLANQLSYVVCVFQGNPGLVEQASKKLVPEATSHAVTSRIRRFLDFGRSAAHRLSRGGRAGGSQGSSPHGAE